MGILPSMLILEYVFSILNGTEPCKTKKATLLEWLIYFIIFWSFFTFPHLIAVSSTVLGLT
ncbi:hypothetical protein QM480_24110, partial [Flectobacillus sp. DC10W]